MRITGARLRQREGLWDIEVDKGRFGRITPTAEPGMEPRGGALFSADPFGPGPGADDDPLGTDPYVVDAGGRLVTAPFAENHIHLDYADTAGQPRENESGTLFEGIGLWAERKELGLNDVAGMKSGHSPRCAARWRTATARSARTWTSRTRS